MLQKASSKSTTYVNVDPKTLEITISKEKNAPMAIPLEIQSVGDMPPMWEVVYFQYMYGEYHRKQQELTPGRRVAASLAPPPPWVVALAGVMWEGIIQGAGWDSVKVAVSYAMSKLKAAGLAPAARSDRTTTTEVGAGFRELSKPGLKQYEMFLSLNRSAKRLPDRHALAYARKTLWNSARLSAQRWKQLDLSQSAGRKSLSQKSLKLRRRPESHRYPFFRVLLAQKRFSAGSTAGRHRILDRDNAPVASNCVRFLAR